MRLLQTSRAMLMGLRPSFAAAQCRMNSNVALNVDDKTGIATLTMGKKPVNSLNLEMLTDLNIALDKLQADRSCKGLILTSGLPHIFSAGLDILEMYQPQPDRLREFWRSLQDVWIKLYGSNLATIAAINGNSPAGGCLLSMCCDRRIMVDAKYAIGLNETKLGIVAPFWFQETMINTIGHRETERALMLGHMYSGEEALKVGLVDSLVPQDALQQAVEEEMKLWLSIPAGARMLTKQQLRQTTVDNLVKKRDQDIEFFVTFITKDAVQKAMGSYLEMLKSQRVKKQAKS